MTTAPAGPTPVKFTDEMREAINGAYDNGTPIVVAYVDENGQPSLSFRGSTQVYSDDQLAIWVRNPEGGLQRAVKNNPRMTILYRNPQTRVMINAQGRAHFESGEDVRNRVYESSPQGEQNADRERKGMALIIDVDKATGVIPGGRLNMQRQ